MRKRNRLLWIGVGALVLALGVTLILLPDQSEATSSRTATMQIQNVLYEGFGDVACVVGALNSQGFFDKDLHITFMYREPGETDFVETAKTYGDGANTNPQGNAWATLGSPVDDYDSGGTLRGVFEAHDGNGTQLWVHMVDFTIP